MPSFFDNETFEREVEEFISTGNASLIQVLVHNSIGLTKYYLSFMVTKINIMNIRLYGEYELKIQCLERYKEIFHKEMRSLRNEEDEELINSIDRSFDFVDKGITLDRVKLVKSFSKEGNEIKREIKKRLKENVFARLPETKEVEKSRYIADHRFFQGEKNITEYTNEIDITDLCSIDYEQILKIYDNFANKTIENMDKEIKDSVDNALERTMEMFSEKRDITVSEYKRCAGKIQQHYSFLKDIEKFTFLSQWYQELENTVAKTIDENIKNVLCPNEKNPPTTLIIAKLSNWFIVRVLHKLLHDKLVKLGKYEGLNFSQEVVELLEEKITRLDDRLLDPEKFVNAIRSALLHSNLTSSKPILSNMLIKEIKPDLSTQAQERLEKARVMANEVWEKDRNSPLCIESFIKVLLQELDNQISECKEEVYLRKLEENIIEEIRNEISKTKSEVFVRDITINALKQQKSTLVLALTIYTVTSYDVIEAGFNILDDMLTEAIKQDKEDLAMLLVCNGADINTRSVNGKTLSEELLTRPAFTEIARLYSSMPKIRARFTTENFERELEMINFITEQASSAKGEKVLDLHSIFTLKELCELLPKDTVFSKISSMLQNYKKEVSCKEDNSSVKLKRSSKQNKEQDSKQVNKTCENEQQSLEQVRKFFEKQEVKKLKVGWACGGGGAIVGVGGGAVVAEVAAGAAMADAAAVVVGGAGVVVAIPFVIPAVLVAIGVTVLASYKIHAYKTKKSDLEISRDDVDELNKALDNLIGILQRSVPSGTNEILYEELKQAKEMINKSKEEHSLPNSLRRMAWKWESFADFCNIRQAPEKQWQSIPLVIALIEEFQQSFTESQKKDELFSRKATTFSEFAKSITGSREEYKQSLIYYHRFKQEIEENKKKEEASNKTIQELGKENMEHQVKGHEKDTQLEEAEKGREEERKGREEAEKGRERAEAKAKAIKEAIELLCDAMEERGISRKQMKQNKDAQSFLEEQYTFFVLNEGYETKFKRLMEESPVNLRDIFEEVSEDFTEQGKEEEKLRKNMLECSDRDINNLICMAVTNVVQAREKAEKVKRTLQGEIEKKSPSSSLNSMDYANVAGPSWKK